jgi:hypothetical protein
VNDQSVHRTAWGTHAAEGYGEYRMSNAQMDDVMVTFNRGGGVLLNLYEAIKDALDFIS